MVNNDLDPHYWLGRLGATIATAAAATDFEEAQKDLKKELERLKKSDVSTPELVEQLERIR